MTKEKFTLEYDLKTVSPNLLWNTLSTASGLEEWFADKVVVKDNKYFTFTWGESAQEAVLVAQRTGSFIRFRWADELEHTYFEFRISLDEITGELALTVTDFAEADEMDDAKILWNKQVKDLFRCLGL
ncbi:MAG: hypothetical protein LBR81_01655 [Prevotellaceae bacterium]|jgi:uncharacterized protein YndB with AHSA1/START domain|nr:hypothetical protein [Prevotellaceae bacterium]